MKTILLITAVVWFGYAFTSGGERALEKKERLSEYNFFKGTLSKLDPEDDVIPYGVNTPLFSNYAEKLRFVKFPTGGAAVFSDSAVFDLPVGTVLIKNFYYPTDFRKPDGPKNIIETRLLVHQPKGWEAWPYIWNDDQTEAVYDPAGETRNISYISANGKRKNVTYAIPNKNQCSGCHVSNEKLMPIGFTARQLNGNYPYKTGLANQLSFMIEKKILKGVSDLSNINTLAVWNDPASGTLDQRARAYLDANCGHCHIASGAAGTSGLFLDIFESRSVHLGVNKTPVAAGRGAGNLSYDIVPGKPEQSILLFRMKTNDPSIAMPELGREQIHQEGVALIEEWIRKNNFQ